MVTAFYFFEEALTTSLNLGFNPQVSDMLDQSMQQLKKLKQLDPANEQLYAEEFKKRQEMMLVYSSPSQLKPAILLSLKVYFGICIAAATLLSLILSVYLSRYIARRYGETYERLAQQNERNRYLEEMALWQQMAKFLVHEIKNPLTPIALVVSNLKLLHQKMDRIDFDNHLVKVQRIIQDELLHLKQIVAKFTEFSYNPKIHLQSLPLNAFLNEMMLLLPQHFPTASFEISASHAEQPLMAQIDPTLLRQVFFNLVRNGLEANSGKSIMFLLSYQIEEEEIVIKIQNTGVPIPPHMIPKIFDLYVSTKLEKQNVGIGLAFVKKTMIEHGGDIEYGEIAQHPVFTLKLKRDEERIEL